MTDATQTADHPPPQVVAKLPIADIFSGLIALLLVGGILYLAVTERAIPEVLTIGASTAIGAYLGRATVSTHR